MAVCRAADREMEVAVAGWDSVAAVAPCLVGMAVAGSEEEMMALAETVAAMAVATADSEVEWVVVVRGLVVAAVSALLNLVVSAPSSNPMEKQLLRQQ